MDEDMLGEIDDMMSLNNSQSANNSTCDGGLEMNELDKVDELDNKDEGTPQDHSEDVDDAVADEEIQSEIESADEESGGAHDAIKGLYFHFMVHI